MNNINETIDAGKLRDWLDSGEPVFVLDVRPSAQREEWKIPGSYYIDAYKQLNEGDESVLNEINIPGHTKVITVCAAGRTSLIASNLLRKKGMEAYSLEGGMKAWSRAWNTAQKAFKDFEVLQVRRTGKGCLSYIVSSHKEAIIIDASLPVEVYRDLIKHHDLSLKYVMETHTHADHLSRSKNVADHFRAPLYLPVRNRAAFMHKKILADSIFSIGSIGLKANEEESRARAIQLFHSLKKITSLPDEVMILPAHTNKPVEFDHEMISSTIGQVKKDISFLQLDETAFVNELLKKIPPTPANYLSIVEKNLQGIFSEAEAGELEVGANRCAV
jgi:rhodanese-related sulfurtransferase